MHEPHPTTAHQAAEPSDILMLKAPSAGLNAIEKDASPSPSRTNKSKHEMPIAGSPLQSSRTDSGTEKAN